VETKETSLSKRKTLCGVTLIAIIVSVALTVFLLPTNQTFQLQAGIIDQAVIVEGFNPDFANPVTNILEEAGYIVDYYKGEEVTVEFYKNLPKYGYSIIIIRTHSRPTGICTGEQYEKTKHVSEQLNGQLIQIFVTTESYFGITATFVENSMRGKFRNSTILMMGCDGLSETTMAEAFVERGAKVYIGWRQSVLANHTDLTTELLLKHLITERKTIEQAVTETMKEVGLYPVLAYYPPEAEEMTVIANKQI